jgi:hypothetical protein
LSEVPAGAARKAQALKDKDRRESREKNAILICSGWLDFSGQVTVAQAEAYATGRLR